jgi:hypothetical protein
MFNVMKWQDLENWVVALCFGFNPTKPSGSGSAKKEEDVVTKNIVFQCKSSKNGFRITSKDVNRLKGASVLLNKTAILVTRNEDLNTTLFSIVVDNPDKIRDIIALLEYKKYESGER